MKHQLGLTLLEVSIALSIGMAILLMATKSVEYLNRYNAIHEVKSEVALLRLALEDYYFNNCAKEDFPQPTIDILKRDKYLPAQFNADNGFGLPYTVYISNTFLNYRSTTKKPPSYTIALSLYDGLSNDVYQQRLGATDTDRHSYLKKRKIEPLEGRDPRRYVTKNPPSPPSPPPSMNGAGDNLISVGESDSLDRFFWVLDTWTFKDKNLRWTYPLPIKRQYGDNSLGRFKRFYSHLKEFYSMPDGGRGRFHDEICTPIEPEVNNG